MKFYLEQITKETSQEAKGLFEYDSLNAAEVAYHSAMASAINNDNVLYIRCRVINQYGMENMRDIWQAAGAEVDEKYYLSQVQFKDGENVKALFEYATVDEAVAAWHSLFSDSMPNTQITAILGIVEDRAGNEIKKEYWQRAVEEVA